MVSKGGLVRGGAGFELAVLVSSGKVSSKVWEVHLEEFLAGCIARLVSVVEYEDGLVEDVIEKAMGIILKDEVADIN
ncbi:MAG: hypothetical protein COB36_09950 [Alphaproteobacteria bacterium]|nr:MAG: hypothetical protein COB36_09950 [Alphaproteobacteria bacterium]